VRPGLDLRWIEPTSGKIGLADVQRDRVLGDAIEGHGLDGDEPVLVVEPTVAVGVEGCEAALVELDRSGAWR
jgi:hypothetical protein